MNFNTVGGDHPRVWREGQPEGPCNEAGPKRLSAVGKTTVNSGNDRKCACMVCGDALREAPSSCQSHASVCQLHATVTLPQLVLAVNVD